MELDRLVYVPDKVAGYVLAQLVDIGTEGLIVKIVNDNSKNVVFF